MKESVLMNLPFDKIKMEDRERKVYDVEELQADIAEKGLIQTIAVEDLEDGTYRVVAGGRRLTACRNLCYPTMPCKVFPPLDNYERKGIELAENIHREDLAYPERASLTKQVHELWVAKYGEKKGASLIGHSAKDTARALGVSSMQVGREIELATAIEIMPELANCKNKSEAMKMLGKVKENLIREELAKRSDELLSKTGKDAAKRVLIDSYIVGDFFDNKLKAKSAHCIEIDSPYGVNLKSQKQASKYITEGYTEISISDYPAFLNKIIKESYRVLMDDGWLIFWFGSNPWHHTVKTTLEKNGFTITGPSAIWVKGSQAQCNWPDRSLASSYEQFFYARKNNAVIFKQGRLNVFDFSTVPTDSKIHPTERPIEMMQEILMCFCPPAGRLVVPCCGSGNTMIAASNLGMHPVGWDISPAYKDYYISKIVEGDYGNYKSYKQ